MINLLQGIPAQLPEELFETLVEADGVRIERIISHGQASPEGFWYDQEQHEWVVVLQGAATLRLRDEVLDLQPGDCIYLPPHSRHRVEWTSPDQPTIWLAVHWREVERPGSQSTA